MQYTQNKVCRAYDSDASEHIHSKP